MLVALQPPEPDPVAALGDAFGVVVSHFARHPLVRRLVEHESSLILPALVRDSTIVTLLTERVAAAYGAYTGTDPATLRDLAEAVVRLGVSLVVVPRRAGGDTPADPPPWCGPCSAPPWPPSSPKGAHMPTSENSRNSTASAPSSSSPTAAPRRSPPSWSRASPSGRSAARMRAWLLEPTASTTGSTCRSPGSATAPRSAGFRTPLAVLPDEPPARGGDAVHPRLRADRRRLHGRHRLLRLPRREPDRSTGCSPTSAAHRDADPRAGARAADRCARSTRPSTALAARQGLENRHRAYPFGVIAHQVVAAATGRGRAVDRRRASAPAACARSAARSVVGAAAGLVAAVERHAGAPTTRPRPGLWAVEPHLGFRGVGAKFEEMLVVTDDDALLAGRRPAPRAPLGRSRTRPDGGAGMTAERPP